MSKVWFVAGATGGFGRLWAEAALDRGDRVVVTGRRVERLDDLVARHRESALVVPLDVTEREAVGDAVSRSVERFGRIDVIVNNAGYGHWGMVEELSERELREQMETNFFGAVWIAQAAAAQFRAQRTGHLIQVTSEGGVCAFPGIGAYHASKWAVEGLSESMAQETAGFGFHVTCVEPGPYATGFAEAVRSSPRMPEYDESRAADTTSFDVGQPEATVPAIMALVDAASPPRRLILGNRLPAIEEMYEDRLSTWREWQEVSSRSFGVARGA